MSWDIICEAYQEGWDNLVSQINGFFPFISKMEVLLVADFLENSRDINMSNAIQVMMAWAYGVPAENNPIYDVINQIRLINVMEDNLGGTKTGNAYRDFRRHGFSDDVFIRYATSADSAESSFRQSIIFLKKHLNTVFSSDL